MSTWPRRISIALLIVIPIFGVASISGTAQDIVDSDTDIVSVEVITRECPGRSGYVLPALMAYGTSGHVSDVGPVMFAQASDLDEDRPCLPEESVTPAPSAEECPGRADYFSPAAIALGGSGQISDVGPVMFAQTGTDQDRPCPPDETVTPDPVTVVDPSETPRADSSGPTSDDFGGAPTVPVVSQLPDTGVAPSNSRSTPVLAPMLIAGLLLMVGGLISSRAGASRPVK